MEEYLFLIIKSEEYSLFSVTCLYSCPQRWLHTGYFKLFSEVSILIYDNICNIHQCMLYSHFNLVSKKYTIDHFINKHKFTFYRDCNLFLMISLALGLYQLKSLYFVCWLKCDYIRLCKNTYDLGNFTTSTYRFGY